MRGFRLEITEQIFLGTSNMAKEAAIFMENEPESFLKLGFLESGAGDSGMRKEPALYTKLP